MNELATKLNLLTLRSRGDYEAFLYDCDGTLANNMHLHKAAYAKAASKYGISLNLSLIDETAGLPTVKVVEEINKRYRTAVDPLVFGREKSGIYIDELIEKTQPMDFVVQHLKAHHGKIHIAVVSGGSRKTVQKTLSVLGLTDYIEVLVCAGDTEKGKPYPDPFLRAATILGVDPRKCLVFEDGDPGVKAAEAAGMDWIRVDKI